MEEALRNLLQIHLSNWHYTNAFKEPENQLKEFKNLFKAGIIPRQTLTRIFKPDPLEAQEALALVMINRQWHIHDSPAANTYVFPSKLPPAFRTKEYAARELIVPYDEKTIYTEEVKVGTPYTGLLTIKDGKVSPEVFQQAWHKLLPDLLANTDSPWAGVQKQYGTDNIITVPHASTLKTKFNENGLAKQMTKITHILNKSFFVPKIIKVNITEYGVGVTIKCTCHLEAILQKWAEALDAASELAPKVRERTIPKPPNPQNKGAQKQGQ